MEDARIKMVGEASWAKETLISALTRLVREKGVLSMFSGLAAMLSKQARTNEKFYVLNLKFDCDRFLKI